MSLYITIVACYKFENIMHAHSIKSKADVKLLTKTRLYEALPM